MAFVRESVEPDASAPLTVVQVGANGRPLLAGPAVPALRRAAAQAGRRARSCRVAYTAPGGRPACRRTPS